VKRKALEKHLRAHGCQLDHEGGKHAVWVNPVTGEISTVPRGNEIKKFTARAICKQLGVEQPSSTS